MRVVPHLLLPRAVLNRRFPPATLEAIAAAIHASEQRHHAEIRFAIEAALDVRALWRVGTVRDRAVEVFAELGVWSTAEHNGVLIYVLLAERCVEIVADHGLTGRVTDAEWREVCARIERRFAAGHWRDGALEGIEAATALLVREFPAAGPNRNEQEDRPVVL
ncbi:MAG TPA: TPM domain-containing protein [Gammaproteobacteria bacterium]|nr:TPM domain-containing protein [Gammaproteobacteria bacterium]